MFDISTDDEPEVFTPGQVSRLVTSRRVEDFGHVHQHLVRFVVSNPLEELVRLLVTF